MNQITDHNDLRLFAEVVEHGSFTAAARSLGAQTSKLSRRIRVLEEEFGVRLLDRTSRSLSLTETGRRFHQHCIALVVESKAAKDIVDQTRTQPQGTVRISCPVTLLNSGVTEIISRYIQDNPQVQVLLDATNRHVDVVVLENTDLAVRHLGTSVQILAASLELVARYSPLASIESLKELPTLSTASDSEKFVRHLTDANGQMTYWPYHPRLAVDDWPVCGTRRSEVLLCRLPRELVAADIRAGRLQHLLSDLSTIPGLAHAIFPSHRGMVPAVRHRLDTLVTGFEDLNRMW